MKSEQVQYFLEAAELGSMLQVAERHYLSQPAVSTAISALEEELGVKLLERSRQGIMLTEAGVIAREHFLAIKEKLQALDDALLPYQQHMIHEEEITVSLCSTIEMNNSVVKEAMQEFYRIYPNCMFLIKEYDFIDMIDAVEKGRYTFGVYCIINEVFEDEEIQTMLKERGLCHHVFTTDRLHVLLAKSSHLADKRAVSLQDVLKQPLVIYNSSDVRCWHELFLKRHHYQGQSVQTNSLNYLADLVRKRKHAAFYLNHRRIATDVKNSNFVVRPIKEKIGVSIGVLYPERIKFDLHTLDFFDELVAVLSKNGYTVTNLK